MSHFGRRISLFLQTLVLRSILSSEQEHRQEHISVGMMRLWPIGSTRGEEANEIEIGNLHESGGPRSSLHVTGGNRKATAGAHSGSSAQFSPKREKRLKPVMSSGPKRLWRWTRTKSGGCWLRIYRSKLPTEN